jgi:hypothetical protein
VIFVNTTTGDVLFNTSDPAPRLPPPPPLSAPVLGEAADSTSQLGRSGAAVATITGDDAGAGVSHAHVEVARISPHLGTIYVWEERPGDGPHVVRSLGNEGPAEQVTITEGVDTDYLWYATQIPAHMAAKGCTVTLEGGKGTLLYAFVGGMNVPVNMTTAGSGGSRSGGGGGGEDSRGGSGMPVTLQILSVALGLSNVNPQPTDSKGIVGNVFITSPHSWRATGSHDGGRRASIDITNQPWTMSWPLAGEAKQIFSPEGVGGVGWSPLQSISAPTVSRVWFKLKLDLPSQHLPPARGARGARSDAAGAGGQQTAYALDLSPMSKGVAYVNGFNIGRYWLVLSGQLNECSEGMCALDFPGPVCYFHKKGCGKPTQHLYHVPSGLLKARAFFLVDLLLRSLVWGFFGVSVLALMRAS